MMPELLANIGILPKIASVLFVLVCIFLILVILIQKGRGGGLSAAFGGAGGQSVFGSKTGDMLTWVTISVAVVFFLLAMYLSPNFKPSYDDEVTTPQLQTTQPLEEQPGDAGDSQPAAGADAPADTNPAPAEPAESTEGAAPADSEDTPADSSDSGTP